MKKLLCAISVFVCGGEVAKGSDVRGSVRMADGTAPSAFLGVELRAADGRGDGGYRTHSYRNGDYELKQVPTGTYLLRITTERGEVIRELPVAVQGPVVSLETTLGGERREQAASGAVSARRLRHEVPKGAQREFARYQKSRAAEDWGSAEEHLRKALAADGEFLEAWVNLGAMHARQQRWEEAAAEFEQALVIDPSCAMAWSNRAFVYLHVGDSVAAEKAVRTAIRYEPGSPRNEYLLELALRNQGKMRR